MKRALLLLFLIAFLVASPMGLAVIPANTQWNLRTDGVDTNGGGFVTGGSGTDRSQQAAAFCTSTDLATTGTAATSAACPFSAASVGNIIQITAGGCTAGFYHVASVAVATATLDRSAGTSTGCTFALGGALLTPAKALAAVGAVNVATVHVKSGTYTITAVLDITTSNPAQMIWEGYGTTYGDGGTAPLITTATNSTKIWKVSASNPGGFTLRNISMSNTAGTRDNGIYSPTTGPSLGLLLDHCILDGFTVAILGNFSTDYYIQGLWVFDTEIKNSSSHGISNEGSTHVYYSYIHDNTGDGVNIPGNQDNDQMYVIDHSVMASNGGIGFDYTSACSACRTVVSNSVFYLNTSDGIKLAANNTNIALMNNIFESNTGFGVNLVNNTTILFNRVNAYFNNTAGARSGLPAGTGDITYTATAFVNPATPNYALNSTAGGGAALKAVGLFGVTKFGTGSMDVGALQTAGAAATGSNSAYVQ
jgi:hypothetical protein